jgi:hypothetical protein
MNYYWIHYKKQITQYRNSDSYTITSYEEKQEVINVEPLVWLYYYNIKGETMHVEKNNRFKLKACLINWKPITELEYQMYNDLEINSFTEKN